MWVRNLEVEEALQHHRRLLADLAIDDDRAALCVQERLQRGTCLQFGHPLMIKQLGGRVGIGGLVMLRVTPIWAGLGSAQPPSGRRPDVIAQTCERRGLANTAKHNTIEQTD